MNDHAEGGIAAVQAKTAQSDGLQKHHKSTIGYLNERILTFVFMLCLIGLVLVWMTSSSQLITYGSLGVVIILAILLGALHIKSIEKARTQRKQQAEEWTSES